MAIKTTCFQDRRHWHKWFAWHPVTLSRETVKGRICVKTAFWVHIERKYDPFWEYWHYREIKDG